MDKRESFTTDENIRYSRHFVLPGFGIPGQEALKRSHALVVGAGGLGAPVLYYLAAAGVGRITIIDADIVSLSNLQRQILYSMDDIGKPKATTAAKRLRAMNPDIEVKGLTERIDAGNVMRLIESADVVIDATDNFPTRYLLNDASVLAGKPLVFGSIFRYEGQVAVFNYKGGPNYRDLYPVPPDPGTVPDCEQGGVLGVLAGIIGCLQANEVLRVLTGDTPGLAGRLLLFDSQTAETTALRIPDRNARTSIRNLIDYDEFCGIGKKHFTSTMKEVTVQELKKMMDDKVDFQLIDVREPHEADIAEIGGQLIPQGDIPSNVDKISRDKQVVIHCRSGARSGNMVQWLEKNHGFTNLYNLKGGILAWADQIDPSVPKY